MAPHTGNDILEHLKRRESSTELELTSLLRKKAKGCTSVDHGSLFDIMEDGKPYQSITNFEAMTHFLQGNIGMGILVLPCAVKYAGLIGGTLGLIFFSFVCTYTMGMLVKSSHKALVSRSDTDFLDYGDTAAAAFCDAGGLWRKCSSFIKKFLNFFLSANQIGTNAVYALFIAHHIRPLCIHYGGSVMEALNYRYYLLMAFPFILLLCNVRDLKYLSPFSLVANSIQFIDLGTIFYFYFRNKLPSVYSVAWFGDLRGFQIFIGIALFSFDGVSVILPIENRMKYPHDMLGIGGVLSKSMAVVTVLFSTFGGFGFLKYGSGIKDTITLSLPIGELAGQILLGSYALAIFFSYALRFYVPMEIIRTSFLETRWSRKSLRTIDSLAIAILNLFIFTLAAVFPDLELFVSLLGAIKMTTLILMAPALIDTASNWKDLGKYNWKAIKNGIIFLFGMIGMIMGTFGCAQKMIENTKTN